ncbi:MAG TPA: M14 family metallocarboxypeptidase [Bacilli bacterium]
MEFAHLREYGYAEMIADLKRLERAFPFLRFKTIGNSVLGRPIPAVWLGNGTRKVHYNASVHANEWITSAVLMRFLADVADAVATGEKTGEGADGLNEILSRTQICVVPMVNPDGVELALGRIGESDSLYAELVGLNGGSTDFTGWKANIRGVDLNDQFPAFWEEEKKRRNVAKPGPRDYGGEFPLSEPEAFALAALARREKFHLAMSFHTQGKEIYWNYRNFEPATAEHAAKRLAAVSGYVPVKLADSDAGFKDWFIYEFGAPGFTVEAGFGVNPLPPAQFADIYNACRNIMLEGLRLI